MVPHYQTMADLPTPIYIRLKVGFYFNMCVCQNKKLAELHHTDTQRVSERKTNKNLDRCQCYEANVTSGCDEKELNKNK